jgi:hypothetical protein
MKEVIKRNYIIQVKAKTKPDIKPKGWWYERRGLLKLMYDKYRNGRITADVIMDAFKVDRLKPIVSAYHRMYGKLPEKHDPTQRMFEWGFLGLIEDKRKGD